MNPDDPRCPIRMQSVPISKEIHKTKYDLEDPLYEDEDSPVPGLNSPISGSCSVPCYESMLDVLPVLYEKTFFWPNWHGGSEKTA